MSKKGEIVIVKINLHPNYQIIETIVGRKYGIKVINLEYERIPKPINYLGIKMFNEYMKNEYINKFGLQKYTKYRDEVDSTCYEHIAK